MTKKCHFPYTGIYLLIIIIIIIEKEVLLKKGEKYKKRIRNPQMERDLLQLLELFTIFTLFIFFLSYITLPYFSFQAFSINSLFGPASAGKQLINQ